ncbi:MAG: UV DNA damage endonuclease [Deltaproteobacteria bacterium ADurb.Bin510]|nr:MAG: UV DNA damage endonuclease [Deltaproteobacteria bacterium ADurb.Bin510]
MQTLEFCRSNGIGAFRLNSQLLPLKTHPGYAYELGALPGGPNIIASLQACGVYARDHGIRLSLHPDQFVVLNSPDKGVIERSIAELGYQAELAELVGADVINLHAGGVYGDKSAALRRLGANLAYLPAAVRSRLSLENDDRSYTPADLLDFCLKHGLAFVYDVHHHRCLADGQSVAEATQAALATWQREPLMHLSSPRAGWQAPNPRNHHDYINPADLPEEWLGLNATIDVEAKAKELAVLQLMRELDQRGVSIRRPD